MTSTPSYVGTHPTGRRYYTRSKTGEPLVFAVFRLGKTAPWSTAPAKWEQVLLVEDRPYQAKFVAHRPDDRDLSPREYADDHVRWYREVIGCEAVVVDLRPTGGKS